MPRRLEQMIVRVQRQGLGPDPLRLILLARTPQHLAQMRGDIAIAILGVGRIEIRQRLETRQFSIV